MNLKTCIWSLIDFYRSYQAIGASNSYKLLFKARFKEGNQTLTIKKPIPQHVELRGKTSDWWVFYQIYVCKEYPFFQNFTPTKIIDAGANIGITSIFYRDHYPDAEIIALEVDENNQHLLKKNLSNDAKTEILNCALWSSETQLSINNPTADNYSFQVEEDTEGKIKGVSIKWILNYKKWNTIDLLKIDIEGAEYFLFNEACDSWLNKVDIIIIELHERYQPGCTKRLFDALSKIDYYFKVKANNLVIINKNLISNPQNSKLFRELFH